MSSDALQSALTGLQQSDYASVAFLTAVVYDYVLTFSEEVEYIWYQPWTWVSTLFVPVRYFGLLNLIISALLGSSFLPGPAKLCLQGQVIGIISAWAFLLFLGAADFVMILRIWAMYNRSKLILGTLLALFSVEFIFTTLAVAINSIPKNLPAEVAQIYNSSFCVLGSTVPMWTNVAVTLQITQGGAMCVLAIVQFVRQSLEMYRATKRWQLNRYMGLLVRQGMLSFLAAFLFNLLTILFALGMSPTGGWQLLLLLLLEYIPIYTLTPRFILHMRRLYALDARRGAGIDTGFGLTLSSRDAGGMLMVFADNIGGNDTSEDTEGMPMEGGMIEVV